jgi:hypothetical protein
MRLGKALEFYLRYPAEMEALYDLDYPQLRDDLEDADHVVRQAATIGDAACAEAADLVSGCRGAVEMALRKHVAVKYFNRKRRSLLEKWSISFKVWRKGEREPKRSVWAGVAIYPMAAGLIPWIWVRGGRLAEKCLASILAAKGSLDSSKLGEKEEGTVGFKPVSLLASPAPDLGSWDQQVGQAFASVTAEEWERILSI